jgi:hypothetical protein
VTSPIPAVSGNAARNLEVSHLTETMRRSAVRFKAMGDESQIKDFNEAQAQASACCSAWRLPISSAAASPARSPA